MGNAGTQTTAPQLERRGLAYYFTQHPIVSFIGLIGSIITIVAFCFPWLNASKVSLAYCVNPVRMTKSEQMEKPNPAMLAPVPKEITTAEVAIWNAGRGAITGDSILGKLAVLRTTANAPMREAEIIKVSREVIRASLVFSNKPSSAAGLAWKILERNDGFVVRVTYEGGQETPIKLDAAIVGQREAHEVKPYHPPDNLLPYKNLWLIALISGALFLVGLGAWIYAWRRAKVTGKFDNFIALGGGCIIGSAIGIMLVCVRTQLPQTPLGF